MCSWRLPAPLCARTLGLAAAFPSRGSPGMARAEAVVRREPARLHRGRPRPACRAPAGRAPSRTCRHLQPPPPSTGFLFCFSVPPRCLFEAQSGRALNCQNRPGVLSVPAWHPQRPPRPCPRVAWSDEGLAGTGPRLTGGPGPTALAAFAFFGCHWGQAAGPTARPGVDGPPQLRRTCARPSAS